MVEGFIDDSDADRQSNELNDRSDESVYAEDANGEPVLLSSMNDLLKIFKVSMTDNQFFNSRKQRSTSQYNRYDPQYQSQLSGGISPQHQMSNQPQYSMFPVLPGLFQMGSYYQPSHPFQQQQSEMMNRIYQQQSQASNIIRGYETEQRFFNTLQQPKLNQQQSAQSGQDVHLAYLFASPLMLESSEGVYHDGLAPIGFKEEFEQILLALEPKQIEFKYRYMVANDANIRECLNDNPIGLHFAGHGFENNEKLYRGDKKGWLNNRGKGDVLLFEKEDGSSSFYSESDLKFLLENTYRNQRLEFVVVASCHSECVGKIFQASGAKHVICIDQKKILQDEAAILFSKTFYSHIFGSNLSICEAFESARNLIKRQISHVEGEKFKMLLNNHKTCRQNEIRRRMVQGQLQYKGITPKILKLPTKVTPFISRNKDMFDVIKTLNECNILQIFGMPGLGKSSLLKNVSNYIGERNLYRDGLIYMNFQTIKTFQEALAFIMQNIEDNIDPNYKMNKIELQFNQSFRKQEKSRLLKQIYKKFQRFKKGMVIVLDNIDDVGKDYQNDLISLITNLVQDSSNSIKILFSSSIFFDSLENYKVKKLRGLSQEDSVELFLTKIPLQNDDLESFLVWDKIVELHNFTIERLGDSNQKVKLCTKHRNNHNFKCVTDYLAIHPLFDLLGGQPLSLSLIAPLSLKFSLKEIYQQLVELPIINVFKGKIKEDALILSLEFSLKILNDSQQERQGEGQDKAVELFYLIGITKEGLYEDDLDQLFEEDDTQEKLQSLVELSLIQFETFDKAGQIKRFKVSPFIDKYIEQKLNQQSKRDLHLFLATYYTNKLISIKKEFMKSGDQKIMSQQLAKYEQNILFCMKELFNFDYQRQMSTPQRKKLKTNANSPSNRMQNKINIDKNMLDFKESTLRPGQSNGFHKVVKSFSKNAGYTPTPKFLNGDSNEESQFQFRNYQDLFDRRKVSTNAPSITQFSTIKPRAFDDNNTDREGGYYNSAAGDSSDCQTDSTLRKLNKTPLRDFKIRQSSVKKYLDQQKDLSDKLNTISDPKSQPKQSRRNLEDKLEFRITNSKLSKNFKDSDQRLANINLRPTIVADQNDVDSDNSAQSQGMSGKFREREKKQYQRQLNKLSKLNKQHINKGRFDKLVKSLTLRMGNSQTDNFDKLIKRGNLNFQQPLQEQLSQLNTYEKLCYHYVSILAILDHRCQEVPKIIYSNENCSSALDKNELIIPLSNKLLQANLKMAYIYYLLNDNKYDAVNGENLELYSLFQDINCPLGEGISLYLKAKYLQKMKRKNAYQKAEKYVLKSAAKFEQCQDSDGLIQCQKLLEKIQKSHPMLTQFEDKLKEIQKNLREENKEILDERLQLDKKQEGNVDRVRNLLLNIIEFSFLKKQDLNNMNKQLGGISSVKEQNIGVNNLNGTQQISSSRGTSQNNGTSIISQIQNMHNLQHGLQLRGMTGTPKIISKKSISMINQPKQAFQPTDQDEQ